MGPFPVGLGGTIANTIRRFLLSDVSGVAFTEVQFAGVTHEYSTIEGVRESALEIMINLQAVVLASQSSLQTPEYGFLEATGPGNITAGSIVLPPFVQCVDPTQHIATLSTKGFLRFKALISRTTIDVSRNSRNDCESLKQDLKWVPLPSRPIQPVSNYKTVNLTDSCDPLFDLVPNICDWTGQLVLPLNPPRCPVTKANFIIQPSEDHLSKETLLIKENVFLEIVTNGSVHPRRALHEASREAVKVFSLFQSGIFYNALIEKRKHQLK